MKREGIVDRLNTRHANFRFETVPVHVAMTYFYLIMNEISLKGGVVKTPWRFSNDGIVPRVWFVVVSLIQDRL
jgi:hypothetical protein